MRLGETVTRECHHHLPHPLAGLRWNAAAGLCLGNELPRVQSYEHFHQVHPIKGGFKTRLGLVKRIAALADGVVDFSKAEDCS